MGNNFISLYRCQHYVSQFNLSKIKYNSNFHEIDIKDDLLANKLFVTNFLQNIIKKFNLDKIKEIIDYYQDKIFCFAIESVAHKFRQITSISLYINNSDCDKPKFNNFSSLEELEDTKVNETIFYVNYLYDNSKNSYEDKEKVLKEFFNVLSIIFNKFTKVTESSLNLLNKFLKSKYISNTNKNLLNFYYKSLII